MGRRPFDLTIRDVQLVNVMTEEIYSADIGIVEDTFAYVGPFDGHSAKQTLDARGLFAVPGFIDAHMHIESSMMTPAAFAQAVLPMGTTTVAADPHEIANVLGMDGVRMMCEMSHGLPLRVHVMAPSTIPSAPGFETSAAQIDHKAMAAMLDFPGVLGMGEMMDFLGVVHNDPAIINVIQAARDAGVLLDGHAPLLSGKQLQAFVSTGINCDHTYMDLESVREKLRYGMCVQIQERYFTPELMTFLNDWPVQNRIMLVTDDVPITRLWERGHVNNLLRKAIAMGLNPQKAIRYVTINAADRLRQYNLGAIAPGRAADMLLLSSLEDVTVEMVFCAGQLIAKKGRLLVPLSHHPFPETAYKTMHIAPLCKEDFAISCPGKRVIVNAIQQDGLTSRTKHVQLECEAQDGFLLQGGLVKMAVFERHTGRKGCSLGLLSNLDGFDGAMASSYAHDCHNLCVYSSNDADAVLAANAVIEMGGGVAAARHGELLCAIALPIAGILSHDGMEELAQKFKALTAAAKSIRLHHAEPLTFLTLMSLAVSPEIKLTDKGILDVINKRFLPLIERVLEA